MADDSGMAGKSQEELDREDELAAARSRRAGGSGEDDGGQSLEDLAASAEAGGDGPEPDADDQYVLDIPEPARKINLGTLIPKGTPTKIAYKMSGKSIPSVQGGLMDPAETTGLLLVSYVLADVDVTFTRDGNGEIKEATVYLTIAPRAIVNAKSEAGRVMLGESAAA